MAADYSKMARLLRLVLLMQQDEAGGAKELADKLGVVERTLYRDLNILESLGIPCYHDPDSGRYRIRKDFFLPPLQLTSSEVLALSVIAEQIAGQEQIALTRPAARALEKIRGQLPDRVLRSADAMEPHVEIKLPPSGPADEAYGQVYDIIQQGIASHRSLRCRYDSLNPETDTERTFLFDPYMLSFDQRAWYVVGHHHARSGIRRLKLVRFTDIRLTDQPFVMPADFSMDAFRGDAWRMVRGDQRYKVVVHFDAMMAETVQDTHWHRTQEVDFEEDGSLIFRCEVEGLDEIVWWVLGYGPHARVIQPPALIAQVAAKVREMARVYDVSAEVDQSV
jgi:predicted DNA-binding transcriptional regulator YafY